MFSGPLKIPQQYLEKLSKQDAEKQITFVVESVIQVLSLNLSKDVYQETYEYELYL